MERGNKEMKRRKEGERIREGRKARRKYDHLLYNFIKDLKLLPKIYIKICLEKTGKCCHNINHRQSR